MILGDITLQEVDTIYKRMNIHELVIFPYRQDGILAGLIIGYITGTSAQLDHYIVLPEAPRKLEVMQQMPKMIHTILKARGITHVLLCIAHDDSRRRGLTAW